MEDTLKDFWATRPRRPRRGRKIAGVAAAIGNRYGVDPIVIRVAFVVATFYGGAGILVYLLGWLLFPEQDDEAAPFESMINHKRSSTSTAFTVLLCLALIPAFLFFVDSEFSGIFGLILAAGALFLLHRSRGHIGRPAPASTPVDLPGPGTSAFGTAFGTEAATAQATPPPVAAQPTSEPEQERPPAWDPLGAAPFAWDLPEPAPPAPEPPAPRRRSRVGLMTVGAALITGGTLAMVAPYAGGWLTPGHIVGIVLAVLGLGMVGGSFVRGGRGLIGLAVPLSVIGLGLTVITVSPGGGVGDLPQRPTSIAQVQDRYQRSAGNINLDLTALPSSGTVDTHLSVFAGEIMVIVPATADVMVTCQADVGDVNCLGETADGSGVEKIVMDHGPDGRGGLSVTLHAEVGAGSVEVRRD